MHQGKSQPGSVYKPHCGPNVEYLQLTQSCEDTYQPSPPSLVSMPRNVRSQNLGYLSTQLAEPASTAFPPHTVVSMPALSPTMTSGNIGTWQKKVGDSIAPGDVLVEIETDKAQMDFEFQEEGTLAKILKDSGEKDVAVGNVSLAASLTTCTDNAVAHCCHDRRRRGCFSFRVIQSG